MNDIRERSNKEVVTEAFKAMAKAMTDDPAEQAMICQGFTVLVDGRRNLPDVAYAFLNRFITGQTQDGKTIIVDLMVITMNAFQWKFGADTCDINGIGYNLHVEGQRDVAQIREYVRLVHGIVVPSANSENAQPAETADENNGD